MQSEDTLVDTLGECTVPSPLKVPQFIDDDARVIVDVEYERIAESFRQTGAALSFENAGPRRQIFFEPRNTRAAIVTCGGLCPGLNNVIQGLVLQLTEQYGVRSIFGIPYGYEGLNPDYGHEFIELTPQAVADIHETGGTILGSSRGKQEASVMVDTLFRHGINILFTIGGDGTLRGATSIYEEIKRRGLPIVVAGIPKTIDNDISNVDRTFGFATAVSFAEQALQAAYSESRGARNGIGLVKVMGRDSGFIAAHSALASNVVDYVLIREVPFRLEGAGGLFASLRRTLEKKGHAVILVAEGAGQEFFEQEKEYDASGNIKYGDIGLYLKKKIGDYCKAEGMHTNLKYIDPSYIIRSMKASAYDAVFCIMLAQNAVHGAMAGKTGFLVGRKNTYFTFIPFALATDRRKKIDPQGYLWSMIREATGQPELI